MKIGIFGGTGLDDPEIMTQKRDFRLSACSDWHTAFYFQSSPVTVGRIETWELLNYDLRYDYENMNLCRFLDTFFCQLFSWSNKILVTSLVIYVWFHCRFDKSKVRNGANGKPADYGLPSDSLTTGNSNCLSIIFVSTPDALSMVVILMCISS